MFQMNVCFYRFHSTPVTGSLMGSPPHSSFRRSPLQGVLHQRLLGLAEAMGSRKLTPNDAGSKGGDFSRGASMYRGVTIKHGRWQARIGQVAGNKDFYLGTFSTKVAPGNVKHPPRSPTTHSGTLNDGLVPPLENLSVPSNLKSFTFNELKHATKNFSHENLIGEGGFGFVFKGWIHEPTRASTRPGSGTVVAVKKIKAETNQGHREWLTEVRYLGQLEHENLVKLIGYCSDPKNRMLVYEFMPKDSLENHLFKKGIQPMSWSTRMQIATDIARGLSFLHSLNANVIYRDLKAANILLDSRSRAKLADFGLARRGPIGDGTHVSTRVVGTMGYAAPEYVASGHLSPKSDVYSFGVVLLELITGKEAMGDEAIGGCSDTLVDWAVPFLVVKQFSRVMDTRLRGEYSKRGAQALSVLALRCLDMDPKNRPAMVEVLAELEQQQAPMSSPQAKLEHRIRTLSTHKDNYVS